MRCEKCGSELRPDHRFCPGCGVDVPTIIDGSYEVERELGRGAFGTTYLARHIVLGRRVVVKLQRDLDTDMAPRFREEAASIGRVDHPNIATILHAGVTSDGRQYLVSKYVEGVGLDQLIGLGALAVREALDVVIGIGGALEALHRVHVIHRDVKPANIIVPDKPTLQFERATLIDFGVFGELARRRFEGLTTRGGEFFGTPAYMAPEQLTGAPQSFAADLYSLGLVLREALSPGSASKKGVGFESLMTRVAKGDAVDPAFPKPVREVLVEMLRPRPEDRIALGEALRQLREIRDRVGQPSPTTTVSPAVVPPARGNGPPYATKSANGVRITIAATAVAGLAVALIVWRAGGSIAIAPGAQAVVSGTAIAAAGILIALVLRFQANARRPALSREAASVVLGTTSRDALTATLALQVDRLVERFRAIGEDYWGHTVALMLKEYEEARDAKDRREALMNVVTLLEKVTQRLSPWWVRHEKAVAAGVGLTGIVAGLWKVAHDVIQLSRGSTP